MKIFRFIQRSLGIKIAFWISITLIGVFTILTLVNGNQQAKLINEREELGAQALSSTILGAIRYPMLQGEQDIIQKQFEKIKAENGDLFVHLLNHDMVVKRSTEEKAMDQKAISFIEDPEMSGLFSQSGMEKIISQGGEDEDKAAKFSKIVKYKDGRVYYEEVMPITNEKSCELCHGSKVKVLGALWVGKDFVSVQHAESRLLGINAVLSVIGCLIAIFLIVILSSSMLAPLQAFVKIASRVSQGDLTQDITVRSEDEVGMVGSAFNEIVLSLRKMVGDVFKVAENVLNSSQQFSYITQQMSEGIQQINGAMNQITNGVTNQTSKIENVSRVMDSVNLSLKGVESKAKVTADGSEFAAEQVNSSGDRMKALSDKMEMVTETVRESVELIKSLENRSQQIGEITVTITNIADQTNLLSLNAAIEAARAGEAGRGFGVVADEIRKLAESSAQAASRIGVLIRNIQEEVGKTISSIDSGAVQVAEGRDLVSQVRAALEKVISSVNESSRMSKEIEVAINEQLATSTHQVVKAVQDVSSIAEQTSSSVEETTSSIEEQTASMEEITSAAQDLSNLAKEMKALVDQFKIA